MKKSYETLQIELIRVDGTDILTASPNGFYGDEHILLPTDRF